MRNKKEISDHFDLLLVLPVPIKKKNGQILVEEQAAKGLVQYVKNFGRIALACPEMSEEQEKQNASIVWTPIGQIPCSDEIAVFCLPWAYHPLDFIYSFSKTKRLLQSLIQRSRYLHFAPFGLIGDWAGLSCEIAISNKRKYCLFFDWVLHKVSYFDMNRKNYFKRVYFKLLRVLMKFWHKRLIHHSSLVLCHGQDTMEAYQKMNSHSYLVHDIHTTEENLITSEEKDAKYQFLDKRKKLKLIYTGRAVEMKGPFDWVKAIHHAKQLGADIESEWLGDGPLHDEMVSLVKSYQLEDVIHLPGFVANHKEVLQKIKESDLFVMTHLSEESPRCLIESLNCGTPIIGYTSHYAKDLIDQGKAGVLQPCGDWKSLGETIFQLSNNRSQIRELIQNATTSGRQFTEEIVFKERAQLIKKHL